MVDSEWWKDCRVDEAQRIHRMFKLGWNRYACSTLQNFEIMWKVFKIPHTPAAVWNDKGGVNAAVRNDNVLYKSKKSCLSQD